MDARAFSLDRKRRVVWIAEAHCLANFDQRAVGVLRARLVALVAAAGIEAVRDVFVQEGHALSKCGEFAFYFLETADSFTPALVGVDELWPLRNGRG